MAVIQKEGHTTGHYEATEGGNLRAGKGQGHHILWLVGFWVGLQDFNGFVE